MIEHPAQSEMNSAFREYFAISEILTDDMFKLQNVREEDESWRRNHIRTMAVLVESYANCFRQIALVGLNTGSLTCSAKEKKVIEDESTFGVCERIKITLKIAYSMFKLSPVPDFGDQNWEKAQKALNKRGALMHPKSCQDLEVSDEDWEEIEEGLGWLFKQHTSVIQLLATKLDRR